MSDLAISNQGPLGRLLKISDVVRETSLHRATIYRAIKAGTFPRARRIGRQRVAWAERDIEAWKASVPTSDQDDPQGIPGGIKKTRN